MTKEEKAAQAAAEEARLKALEESGTTESEPSIEDEPKTDEEVNQEIDANRDIANLIGKDTSYIIANLMKRKDYNHVGGLTIKNVTFPESTLDADGKPNGSTVVIVVNRALPAYMQTDDADEADEQGYGLTTSNNIFTNVTQLSAILKGQGEIVFGNGIVKNPTLLRTILEDSKISVFSRNYDTGDIEQNPFAREVNDYEMQHRSVRHYIYDVTLGVGARKLKDAVINKQAEVLAGEF